VNSKDNPHKPGTQEWSDYEKTIINKQTFFTKSPEYKEAKEAADKRIKTAGERYAAEYEKGVWVDDVLEFLDGDEPEYDEVLDVPVEKEDSNFWNYDPLGWKQLLTQAQIKVPYYSNYLAFLTPIFKGNEVWLRGASTGISNLTIEIERSKLLMREFTEEEYKYGTFRVAIPKDNYIVTKYTGLDPVAATSYGVIEFYIRRKT
jgi:hypothetical protein